MAAVDIERIRRARRRIDGHVAKTPLLHSQVLSARTGADLHLKFENLQFTASFKERGALNRLLTMTSAQRRHGVVAMSAGNHGQALARHGARLGIPVSIVMPRTTPNAKVAQTRVFGAEVILHGDSFVETLAFTQTLAEERRLTLIHPFDDEEVIAGQGTLGLEIVEQMPDAATLIVPVGGGGLLAGVAVAAKAMRPDIHIVGVQSARFSAVADAFNGRPPGTTGPNTVAEGFAVETPGSKTLPLIRRYADRMVTVTEHDIEGAIFALLEVEKTVVEGAGAAGLAAVMADVSVASGKTVLVLSGGNIDMMVLSSVLQRGLVRHRRLVRMALELPDVPGALATLVGRLAALNSNIVDIVHRRAFDASSARTAVVDLVLQMQGEAQAATVVQSLRQAGYDVRLNEPLANIDP